jgi:hypothetical protein
MPELELLSEIWPLLIGNYPAASHNVDAAFVFGRAEGDWENDGRNEGLLELAEELVNMRFVNFVAIPGHEGNFDEHGKRKQTSYPGAAAWKAYLHNLNIAEKKIKLVPSRAENPNTKTEGDDLVRLAQLEKWRRVIAIMQPHQAERALLALVKSMTQLKYSFLALPVFPRRTDWYKEVYGSQGDQKLPRYLHRAEELRRIPIYQEKGDLATWEELVDYLLATHKAWHA